MYVEPASIYSFVVASIASLVITHLMLHFHRSVNEKELNFDETKTKLSGKTNWMTHLVNIIIFTAGILLISGSLFYSFNIEFKGVCNGSGSSGSKPLDTALCAYAVGSLSA